MTSLASSFLQSTKRYLDLPKGSNWSVSVFQELKEEWRKEFEVLLRAAEEEGPEGWFAIAHGYSGGWGPARDHLAAKAWFTRAAEAGHSQSMVRLGSIRRPATEAEDGEAINWLKKAAALGNASGLTFLGFAYREGQGVEQDYHQAAKHFIAAYEAGDHHAAVHAGKVLAHYLKDSKAGLEWFLKGAEQNCSDAPLYMAQLYGDRKLPTYDPAKAVFWNQSIMDEPKLSGKVRASLALARHYRDGEAVAANKETALQWLDRFAQIKNAPIELVKEAKKLREELEGGLL